MEQYIKASIINAEKELSDKQALFGQLGVINAFASLLEAYTFCIDCIQNGFERTRKENEDPREELDELRREFTSDAIRTHIYNFNEIVGIESRLSALQNSVRKLQNNC